MQVQPGVYPDGCVASFGQGGFIPCPRPCVEVVSHWLNEGVCRLAGGDADDASLPVKLFPAQ